MCTFGSPTDFIGFVSFSHTELSEGFDGCLPEELDEREEMIRVRISLAVVALTLES